jgi:hypothetical protein
VAGARATVRRSDPLPPAAEWSIPGYFPLSRSDRQDFYAGEAMLSSPVETDPVAPVEN